MHRNTISSLVQDTFDPAVQDQAREIMTASKERERRETLHNLRVMVDELGVGEVLNRMEGDCFWKLYTYFRNTMGDSDHTT